MLCLSRYGKVWVLEAHPFGQEEHRSKNREERGFERSRQQEGSERYRQPEQQRQVDDRPRRLVQALTAPAPPLCAAGPLYSMISRALTQEAILRPLRESDQLGELGSNAIAGIESRVRSAIALATR